MRVYMKYSLGGLDRFSCRVLLALPCLALPMACLVIFHQYTASTKSHVTRVTGGDWHPTKRSEMLTCSVDRSVRLWNLNGKMSFDNLINQSVSDNPFRYLTWTIVGSGCQ